MGSRTDELLDEMEMELGRMRRILADFRNRLCFEDLRGGVRSRIPGGVRGNSTPVESPDGHAYPVPGNCQEKSRETHR